MNLPDLKKLKAIIALCRKSGVETIEIEGIKITLRESAPAENKRRISAQPADNSPDALETEELTGDQLLNWSVYSPPETEGKEQ